MKRLLITTGIAIVAALPAVLGLIGNDSFGQSVPVQVPARATLLDDHGGQIPPRTSDDSGAPSSMTTAGTTHPTTSHPASTETTAPTMPTSATATTSDDTSTAEPGDDRGGLRTGAEAEPGDDHGGMTSQPAEAGDDHSDNGSSIGVDDNSGRGASGGGSQGGSSSRGGNDGADH